MMASLFIYLNRNSMNILMSTDYKDGDFNKEYGRR